MASAAAGATSKEGQIAGVEEEVEVLAVKSVARPLEKTVNCLFCYGPVAKYNGELAKAERRVMVKTSERLFLYVCNHLELDTGSEEGFFHMTRKSKKEGERRLLPGNLPLCPQCKSLYYYKMYDAFVAYEMAMDKLSKQISACIMSAIATSAKKNAHSVEEGQGRGPGGSGNGLDDLITFQQASWNEHEVMKVVRQFRKKVTEKNPIGYADILSEEPVEMETTTEAVPSSSGNSSATTLPKPAEIGISNVINVVKTSAAETLFKTPEVVQKVVTNRLRETKKEMEEDSPQKSSTSKSKPLQYYAVANPSPGVIQIIPMNTPKEKSKRRRIEPEYMERRMQQNTCKFCNKYMTDPLSLKRHMVSEHGMEKPEKCPKCDFRTIEKTYLAKHIETHLDEKERLKPYRCTECGKDFLSKSSLKKHMDMHTGNRQIFQCELCGKQFKDSVSRKLCLDKHNGIKNHVCPYPNCDKRFLRKEVLKIHERTHTGEKPYACKICGKCFSQRSPLTIHLKNIHNK